MQTQKSELENAKTSAEKKLETQSKKDKNSLDSMKRKLDGYANDFAKETSSSVALEDIVMPLNFECL